ncbi:MAG: site-specific DNA-methyltransferase [Nitrospirae bacterium]|nr:site-specific DNA-methyltransferase [Nitrospirota bacterium]
MPTIDFKGKQYIYSHHHSVPFRELVLDEVKSLPVQGKKPNLDDNLIIHGDNLHALKALMPQYAGKIKCIYIDPPYNTGNEGWCYNDNVNSPLMKQWLEKNANPVDKEDLERHDKWLCMMYPRLKLLHDLLADDGVIFVSIDDNEVHHLRAVMDEIWGENLLISQNIRISNSAKNSSNYTSITHDYTVVYSKRKNAPDSNLWRVPKKNNMEFLSTIRRLMQKKLSNEKISEEIRQLVKYPRFYEFDHYYYVDGAFSELGPYASDKPGPASGTMGHTDYSIPHPVTKKMCKIPSTGWAMNKEKAYQMLGNDRWHFGEDESTIPRPKAYLFENDQSQFTGIQFFDSQKDAKFLQKLAIKFNFPKPVDLIKEYVSLCPKDSIILDSFAGSGTTAHAVLALNKEDGGNRKFILVEMEDYADSVTAERVRRVIKGVPTAKDEKLRAGLGGSFTFCELGKEISIEKILTGESLPDYSSLAKYVFYTATGKSLDKNVKETPDYFVGETDLYEVYLIYKPDIAFLRGSDSALNDIKLKVIADRHSKKEKLVFATAKYMGQKELSTQNITFCQLPYAIHKVVGA